MNFKQTKDIKDLLLNCRAQDSQNSVLILGMGTSGLSALRLCLDLGLNTIAVNSGPVDDWRQKIDSKLLTSSNLELFSQEELEKSTDLQNISVLVLSPGIAQENDFVVNLLSQNLKCTVISEIELGGLFLYSDDGARTSECVIGVTGTNGKTTTVSLLAEMYQKSQRSVFLGGNIGTPFCDYISDRLAGRQKTVDFIVLELSSFQLETTELLPIDFSCYLNLSLNHSERYESLEKYGLAKWRIVELTNEKSCLPNDSVPRGQTENLKSQIIRVSDIKSEIDLKHLSIPGEHNRENARFALWAFQESMGYKGFELPHDQELERILSEFKGVEHRIERVKAPAHHGPVFNDAKSTNWNATQTALQAVQEYQLPISLLLGGKVRRLDDEFKRDAKAFLSHLHEMNVTRLYLFGESGPIFYKILKNLDLNSREILLFDRLDDLFEQYRPEECVLLFSPALPSFDQYLNYMERGKHFKSLVGTYFNNL